MESQELKKLERIRDYLIKEISDAKTAYEEVIYDFQRMRCASMQEAYQNALNKLYGAFPELRPQRNNRESSNSLERVF